MFPARFDLTRSQIVPWESIFRNHATRHRRFWSLTERAQRTSLNFPATSRSVFNYFWNFVQLHFKRGVHDNHNHDHNDPAGSETCCFQEGTKHARWHCRQAKLYCCEKSSRKTRVNNFTPSPAPIQAKFSLGWFLWANHFAVHAIRERIDSERFRSIILHTCAPRCDRDLFHCVPNNYRGMCRCNRWIN